MPPTPSSVPVREESKQAETQRNERPFQGEKEPKFVIKLLSPVPG